MQKLIFLFCVSIILIIIGVKNLSPFETNAASPTDSSEKIINILSFLPMPSVASDSAFSVDSLLKESKVDSFEEEVSPTPLPDFCMNVPVLIYHHTQPLQMATLLGHPQLTVDSTIFDEQMRYLAENGYHAISAEDLIVTLKNEQQLPEKTVVVTIDDGYDDNYTYAFSSAKKYNVLINFMIPTGLIGNPGYMTWEHLKEMKDSPYAKIYNHTWSHAALAGAGFEKTEFEVMTASKQFEEYLGIRPTVFTYPYGSFDDSSVSFLKNNGFIGAYSTIEGSMQCKSQIMMLQRLHIGNAPLSFYGF